MGSSQLRSHNRNIRRFSENLKKTAKQAFRNEADKVLKVFLFGKLPVEIVQELTMANKEESSPEEIKTYLMHKYQYQQYTTTQTTIQHFNAVTSTNSNTTRSTQPERKKFEGQCFYSGKTGHCKRECRGKQRFEANGIKNEEATPIRKQTDPDKLKDNSKLVCQICGYTNSQEDNKNRRQELKRQQRPISQMEAVDEDDEHDHYSDEDINQGF